MQQPVTTQDKIISVAGKVFYNDRRRRIDLKRPIRNLFEGDKPVGYTMELCLSVEQALARVKELHGKKIMPVLLYFTEEVKE